MKTSGNTETINFRPQIAVRSEADRPFWSVIIPTFNDGRYLRECLHSVLAQDPGPAEMQIEVVDDQSTKGNPESIVNELGQGRVAYHRQPQNVGATRNFSTCIERSIGEWVHILHADDLVLPGFYEKLRDIIIANPEAGSVFCRHVKIDDDGWWIGISDIEQRKEGVIPGWDVNVGKANRMQFCSTVVKRSAYEAVGGFDLRLCHAADWDMWKRVAVHAPVCYAPHLLACYRIHTASHTSSLFRSGTNIVDIRRAVKIAETYYPADIQSGITAAAREYTSGLALAYGSSFLENRDRRAGISQLREAFKCQPSLRTGFRIAKLMTRSFLSR